ncbi:imidazoleglycerol-phosphate dehydratase, partial [bacterium]
MGRTAKASRKTKETEITVELDLDGSGTAEIETGIPFFNHMLEIFARHGLFDLKLKAKGDIDVDFHHTVEDVGLTLGQAFKEGLGNKQGLCRFGEASVPLDETLAHVVVDLSGRPYLSY